MLLNKYVTTTKRNHRYFGPTESQKMSTTLEEIDVDLNSIYSHFNTQSDELTDLSDTYVSDTGTLKMISSEISEIESTLEKLIYIMAIQDPIY